MLSFFKRKEEKQKKTKKEKKKSITPSPLFIHGSQVWPKMPGPNSRMNSWVTWWIQMKLRKQNWKKTTSKNILCWHSEIWHSEIWHAKIICLHLCTRTRRHCRHSEIWHAKIIYVDIRLRTHTHVCCCRHSDIWHPEKIYVDIQKFDMLKLSMLRSIYPRARVRVLL